MYWCLVYILVMLEQLVIKNNTIINEIQIITISRFGLEQFKNFWLFGYGIVILNKYIKYVISMCFDLK